MTRFSKPRFSSVYVLSGIAVLILIIWPVLHVLTPFVVAAVFAYIAVPLVTRLVRWRVPRTLAVLLVLGLFVLLLVLLLLLIIPMFIEQVQGMAQRVPMVAEWAETQLSPWLQNTLGVSVHFNAAALKTTLQHNIGDIQSALSRMLPQLTERGMALVTLITSVALTPVVAFYFVRDWDGIVARIAALIPRRWAATAGALVADMDRVLGEFLRGQLAVMLIMALLYGCGWWGVGLQSGFAIGIVAGILVFIPYVGAFIGMLLATLAAILQFGDLTGLLKVWAVYGVVQTVESFFITPVLVGERIGLHPVLVIFALMAFGQMFGFVGVLVALPVSAMLLVLWRAGLLHYFSTRFYRRIRRNAHK